LEAIDRFEGFLKSIGVPTRLSDASVSADEIDALTDNVVKISFGGDGKLQSRPSVDRDDVRRVYELAL
jgi:alcohol dehydrogenase YqhD (iron-dependent ADH family)